MYMKVENEIMKNGVETLEYGIGRMNKWISVSLFAVVAYLAYSSKIVFSVVVGLYLAEFVLYRVMKEKEISLQEIVIAPIIETNSLGYLDIVLEHNPKSIFTRSSLYMGRLDGDIHRAVIHISRKDKIWGLRLLAQLRVIYHILTYSAIIEVCIDEEGGFSVALSEIPFIKTIAFVYSIKYIPSLFRTVK